MGWLSVVEFVTRAVHLKTMVYTARSRRCSLKPTKSDFENRTETRPILFNLPLLPPSCTSIRCRNPDTASSKHPPFPSSLGIDSAFPLADDPSRMPTAYEQYSRRLYCNPMLSLIHRLSSFPCHSRPSSKPPTTSLRCLSTSSLPVVIPRRHPPVVLPSTAIPRSPQILRAHPSLIM